MLILYSIIPSIITPVKKFKTISNKNMRSSIISYLLYYYIELSKTNLKGIMNGKYIIDKPIKKSNNYLICD